MTTVQNLWQLLNTNSGAVSVLLAIALPLIGIIFGYFRTVRNKRMSANRTSGLGGTGGNATVSGNGVAVGGIGGRAGLGGVGGRGGDANVQGDGFAVGGAGGDAAVPWRPAMGGSSSAESLFCTHPSDWAILPKDDYGFVELGRGGFGGFHTSTIRVADQMLPIEPLLRFLNYWAPEVIDSADRAKPKDIEAFWEAVRRINPSAASAAEAHVAKCVNETIPGKIAPPNPYQGGWRRT